MRHTIKLSCFMLFVLMACGDEGGPASSGSAESVAIFSRLHEDFERFAKIQESAQFSTLSSGFTFENNASCGSAFIETDADFSNQTRIDLAVIECFEFSFDGEDYFYIVNSAPLDNDQWLHLRAVFFGNKPLSGNYDLNCISSDCDPISLILWITDSEGGELVHYHGMPNVLTVQVLTGSVTASFDGLFYSDFEDEPFTVAGTLVCCQ